MRRRCAIVSSPLAAVLAMLWQLLPALGYAAAGDVAGSRDPQDAPRYPFARIVEYEADDRSLPRQFAVGRVDRSDRQVRMEDSIRTRGSLERVTYRIPDGSDVDDVVAHYRRQLGGNVLFFCRARDCGRSNYWANDVFGVAELYGPDANQRYLALEQDGRLVSLYVVERGNQRVYAHLEVVEPETGNALRAADPLRQLANLGYLGITGVVPAEDGSLPADLRTRLEPLADRLSELSAGTLFVVCHVRGRSSPTELLAAAERCAGEAAQVLRTLVGGRVEFEAFGAGPLLPRPGVPGSRLELVRPQDR